MRAAFFALVTSIASTTFAAPTTMPATQPTWSEDILGRTILRPFDTAPYPHASRANGFKSSAGEFSAAEHYSDSTVGIVVPRGYTPGDHVDYVVYFHGHKNHVSRVLETFKLAEQLGKSGVNAILLVPQGPLDVADSGGGKLELDDDGFRRFIDDVTSYLNAEGVIHTTQLGHIALAAHSGGYKVTASILHRGGLTDSITDVILLDATYGNLNWIADYVATRPDARIVSFHTQHLDEENVALKALLDAAHTPNREVAESDFSTLTIGERGVTFISTKLPHNDVPSAKDFLALTLSTARLAMLPGAGAPPLR